MLIIVVLYDHSILRQDFDADILFLCTKTSHSVGAGSGTRDRIETMHLAHWEGHILHLCKVDNFVISRWMYFIPQRLSV